MQPWEGAVHGAGVCPADLEMVRSSLCSKCWLFLGSWLGLSSIHWNPTARQMLVPEPASLKVALQALQKWWFLSRQRRHLPVNALFQPFAFSSLHLFRNMSPCIFWQLHLIKNACMKNVFTSIPELAPLSKNLNFRRNCSDTFSDPSFQTYSCEVFVTFLAAEVCRVTYK